jgi:hypothetical protein
MKTQPLVIIALLGVALLIQGCTKPVAEQEQTKAERIAAIDVVLHAGPTGRPGDADKREALRTERAHLTGSVSSRPIVTTAVAAKPQQATQAPQIVVAHDSQAASDTEWNSTKAALDTRSQRAQELSGRHWYPGLTDGHGHSISRRAFQESVTRQIEQMDPVPVQRAYP